MGSFLNGQVCDRKLSAYSYSSLVFVQVVGCADALKIDKHWSNLVASSQQRRRYFKVKKPYYALFTDSSLEEMKKMEDEFETNLTRTGIPGVAKIAGIQQVPMDVEIPDEEEVVEAYDNHGDVDEDVEDV
jgi:hypothetical protein